MKKLLLALLVTIVLVLPARAVEPPKLSVSSRYELAESGREVRSVHTIVPAVTGDLTLLLPLTGARDMQLNLVGSDEPIEIKSEDVTTIRLATEIKATNFSFSLSQKKPVELSFVTDNLVKETGKSTVFTLPEQPLGEAKVDSIELIVPTSRGLAVSYATEASDTSIGSGRQSYRFDAKSGGAGQIMMLFGTATTAHVKWEKRLQNGSWWWRREKFILPPDTNQQTVFLKNISPRPTSLGVDRDGNLIAEYRIGPKKSIIVSAEAAVSLKSVGYNTTNTRTLADIPQQLEGYVSGDDSNPADTTVLSVVEAAYRSAIEQIRSSQSALSQSKLMAETAERLRKGGVPTRQVEGVKLVNAGQVADTFAPASWLEAFVPGIGWMSVDPFAEQYGQSDFAKIGLLIKSPVSPVSDPTLTEGLNLSYSDEVLSEPDFSKTAVKLIKYPILPGLSLAKLVITMPPGMVLDGAAAAGPGVQAALGSLAPLQTTSRWALLAGGSALNRGETQFGRGGDNGIGEVLATGDMSLSWLLAVGEVIAIILIVLIVRKWRHTASRLGSVPRLRHQHSDSDVDTEDLLRND